MNDNMPSFSANPESPTRNIVFAVFHRAKLIDVAGPLQVFNDAKLPSGSRAYRVYLVSQSGGPVATDTGICLETEPFTSCDGLEIDTLLLAGGESAFEAAHSLPLLAFVEHYKNRCHRLASVCLGAFILAKGGHLNGRRATTHWENCTQLESEYPRITVRKDSIFEKDGHVWTSAGVTAGIDMALAMVEDDLGRAETLRLSKSMVLHVRRTGGQKQFSEALARQSQAKSGLFDVLTAKVMANLNADLSVANLARMSVMSERTFARQFKHIMQTSPAKYVEQLRISAACDAMQAENLNLSELIAVCGFSNAEHMRRAFHRHKGVSPSEFQARFGR